MEVVKIETTCNSYYLPYLQSIHLCEGICCIAGGRFPIDLDRCLDVDAVKKYQG
jgi:hypothetical protein